MPPTLIDPPKGDAFACRNEQALAIDYEEEPPMFRISDTHFAASWMLDARAQQSVRHSPEETTSVSVHPRCMLPENAEILLDVRHLSQVYTLPGGRTAKALDDVSSRSEG